jgi:CRISPR/Cas system-associated exonuclease Cas4 (RecB family)
LKRIFERGDLEEIRVIRDLQSVGVIVDGAQNAYSHGRFISGHNDGLLRNLPDCPDEEVLLEIKTAKDSKFKEFQKKKDVKKVHPVYYGQMIVYMYKRNISNALFIVTNKDTEERYYEIVRSDHDLARELLGKAEDITRDANPPAKLSEAPSWFECKFCPAKEVCHYGKTPEKNCRTCEHAATRDSTGNEGWWCTFHGRSIDEKSCEPCENYSLLTSLSN